MTEERLWRKFLETDEHGKPVPYKSPIVGISRRAFLTALGYTSAAIGLMSCRVPEQKIIPQLRQAPEQTPGVSSWYASTCAGCSAGCGTLVKVRDGRPIKLEGNPEHPVSKGGLCPVAHSLVFGLFDPERLRKPLIGGKEATWKEVDEQVTQRLTPARTGGKIRFLSNSVISPTSRSVIEMFISGNEDAKHIVYEPVSTSAVRTAHKLTHGVDATPMFHFDKAQIVVSFDADFLGTWISPVQFTREYSRARDLKGGQKEMLKHIQFESRMSLTGANADKRIKTSAAEQIESILYLFGILAEKGGKSFSVDPGAIQTRSLSPAMKKQIASVAGELLSHRGSSLVICGSNDTDTQQVVNSINDILGNYGNTIGIDNPTLQAQGNDREFAELIREMNAGEVTALFMLNVNPVYDCYSSEEFAAGLKKVPLKVSFDSSLNETGSLADFVCPDHHSFEAWGDAETLKGTYTFNQPTIAPLFETRAYQESLMRWSGDDRSFYEVLRTFWKENLFPKQAKYAKFEEFWDNSLHDGIFVADSGPTEKRAEFTSNDLDEALSRLGKQEFSDYSLAVYQKTTLRDGRFANSPWLQELPDPITKTAWDNYACLSPGTASKLDLEEGRVVTIKKGSKAVQLPILIQRGQSDDCVAIALGYGRTKAGKAGNEVGANAFPFVSFSEDTFRYSATDISIEPTENRVYLAKTQTAESTLDPAGFKRPLIQEYSLNDFVNGKHEEERAEHQTLWHEHDYPDHKWGMVIDLSACTGCNACVLSCQAENNIPVVGKDEVGRRREMHWLRIDRYYEESGEETKTRFQPLPCMQCDNASCESVCPVLATVHSSEGLNMQVYNRCVGTRYCANNCPYKVRRFNWFQYPHDDPVANLALNPDVTVRSRGVMEKCTFCVQRIEEKKIIARNENRPIADGEIKTACQQSCPADAIVFGDLKDLKSSVNQNKKSGRDYVLLEDLNRNPAVSYLAKVTNSEDVGKEEH
ncbi:MAG: 4Fe-4S dicluster domain-containing protein [Acidobacteriota bacterium]|nr:4Fe-4S dicluster domain-containing protein [Acidobacteriota bacterium]